MSEKADKRLMTCRQIQDEYDLTRYGAEAVMRHVPKVMIEGIRKTYVRRRDVEDYMDKKTVAA